MMGSTALRYRVVDVFAERPFEGNPLTVVMDANGLSVAQMQALASETNHSETTFVTGAVKDGAVPVRIFTPRTELPFAGHPTLGTAYVLGADALDLRVGRIPIQRQGGLLWMTQKGAQFGSRLNAQMLERCLGVPAEGEIVSTGTPVAIVEVADSEAVRAAALDFRAYAGPEVAGIYVFADSSDHDLHARFFADFVGIPEDPATGGAAGPLAAWLHRHGRLESPRIITQGLEMGRRSSLHITFDKAPQVGGRVQDVARGEFLRAPYTSA
jgi:trans-2,3-dihydro-3-hydroxyanthranilate isomerase